MDASAHLKGLGWRGLGYSLDHNDRGIARPLLVTHKRDARGLGSKSQKERQADQWWLNAFDAALRQVNGGGVGEPCALAQVRTLGAKGGLYGFFVKGETLGSTFRADEQGEDVKSRNIDAKRRKAKDSGEVKQSSKKRKEAFGPDNLAAYDDTSILMDFSEKKRLKYQRKAKEQGISIEEYGRKRLSKKARKP